MSALDLKAIRGRAEALRNEGLTGGKGEDPFVEYHFRHLEDDHLATYAEDPGLHVEGYYPAGCVVFVADGCEFCSVPTNEGEQMAYVADAIATVGADVFALLDVFAMSEMQLDTWRDYARHLCDIYEPVSDDALRVALDKVLLTRKVDAEVARQAQAAEIGRLRVLCVAYGLDPDEVIEFKPKPDGIS